MNKPKHTMGPWQLVGGADKRSAMYIRSVMSVVGEPAVCKVTGARTSEETHANAALIAAAPDLLAACEAALKDIDAALRGGRPPMHAIDLAALLKAAVEKAEGTP